MPTSTHQDYFGAQNKQGPMKLGSLVERYQSAFLRRIIVYIVFFGRARPPFEY